MWNFREWKLSKCTSTTLASNIFPVWEVQTSALTSGTSGTTWHNNAIQTQHQETLRGIGILQSTGTSHGPKFRNPCSKSSTSEGSDISSSALAFLIKQGRLLLSFIDFIKRKWAVAVAILAKPGRIKVFWPMRSWGGSRKTTTRTERAKPT